MKQILMILALMAGALAVEVAQPLRCGLNLPQRIRIDSNGDACARRRHV